MKISNSVRELFNSQEPINKRLAERVKDLLEGNKKDNWFYTGRVKKLESFAQKIETGRFIPSKLEDFFACTIVVENRGAIEEAVQLVKQFCIIIERRPKTIGETNKSPESFAFDDLRLYVKLKPSEVSPPTPLDEILFEIQIKTFLQHAWSIATHDLIYKGSSINWGKARLAYQIKAMLEHAEISIDQVEAVSNSSALSITDFRTSHLNEITNWLQDNWESDFLPVDLVRLSRSLFELMHAMTLKLDDITQSVKVDTQNGYGSNEKNLSPYEIVIKAIFNHRNHAFLKFLQNHRTKTKILVTPEMELALPADASHRNLVFAVPPKQINED